MGDMYSHVPNSTQGCVTLLQPTVNIGWYPSKITEGAILISNAVGPANSKYRATAWDPQKLH